jgi:hypothetical protein
LSGSQVMESVSTCWPFNARAVLGKSFAFIIAFSIVETERTSTGLQDLLSHKRFHFDPRCYRSYNISFPFLSDRSIL